MDTALRILQIYPKADYYTGAAIQLRELTEGLQQRGHEVIVATRPSEAWASRLRQSGIAHHAVPMSSEVDLRSVRALIGILRRHRVQIVHAQKGKARTLAMMAGLFAKIPVLILNRGVSFPPDPFNRLGYTTRRVTAIVAVCDSIKRGLVASGVPAEKIHVIYSGTDTKRFSPTVDGRGIRCELGLDREDFLFIPVGVRSWKGNDDAIDAFALVAAHRPRARLLIAGARDPRGLRDRAATRAVSDRLRFLGYRDDVPEILAASDCCIDASYAGLGLTGTLREALAVEVPVIATDLEGNPELVVDGRTGLLFPPRDVPALAAAMLRMLDDRELAETTARAGRQLVEARFSSQAKLDATEALYRRLYMRFQSPACSKA